MTQQGQNSKFKTFVIIWIGIVITAFGTELTTFAFGVWVYQRTGLATQFALISVFAVLPSIVISPWAGALVDRWDRRWVLIISDAVAAVGTLIAAGLLFADRLEVWHVYLITVVNSICGAFFQPAFAASTTLLVPKEHYSRASGMMQSGFAAARIISPMLAGVLVLTIQMRGVLLIDFVTFVIAIIILFMIRIPDPSAVIDRKSKQEPLGEEAAYGWQYIVARPGLFALLVFFAITNFTLGIVQVLIAPLTLSFADAAVLGRVSSTAGIGALLGGIVMSIWGGPKRRVYGVLGFTLLQGMILFLGGWQPSALLIAVAAAIFIFSSQVINGCSQAIWQSKVAPDVQGRIFAIRSMIAWSSLPVAYIVAGPLADYVFEPLLAVGGSLSGSIGQIIGVGPGRGIGLLYIVLGVFTTLAVIVGYLYPRLRLVELEIPDALVEKTEPIAQAIGNHDKQGVS